jgi:uncharacterized protein
MVGETNLSVLLKSMTPTLDPKPFGIVLDIKRVFPPAMAFALIAEEEGVTIIAPAERLTSEGFDVKELWAKITLEVHSSLEAVGLTAAFAKALGEVDISANVVAGFHHDHIFVQWDKREAAIEALTNLSRAS